jgi:cellulose synthase/poly-beta-1,6-N-acetylglucosamine synthase-like glycosyltransferase
MTHWVFIILVALTAYYAVIVFSILVGTLRVCRGSASIPALSKDKANHPFSSFASSGLEGRPFVSVLVPARNEEENIGECLTSLMKQDYPKDKYEIVAVNDRSTDNTYGIIKGFEEQYTNVVCLNIESLPEGMVGKQHAVKQGLEVCNGELILNTDADCILPPSWISRIVDSFDEQTGFVAGMVTTAEKGQRVSLFARLQALDLIYLMNFAIGCIGLGKPTSCIGNNIAYRKQVLDDIGGYESLGYTMTEDAALIQAVGKRTNWKVDVALHEDAVITTKPVEKLKSLYRQRSRWILGGRDTQTKSIVFLQLALWFNLALLALFPISFFVNARLPIIVFGAFIVKLLIDFIFCFPLARKIKRLDLLKWMLPYEPFLIFYSVLIGFGTLFARKVTWKGQTYRRKNLVDK